MLGRLKELSELIGCSGDEGRVRRYIRNAIREDADECRVDHIGNLYAYKHGSGPKVMVTAHMDEVGLQINGITEDGLLCYDQEGIDPRALVSKRLRVGPKEIPGVIGAVAHHLQEKKDFDHVLSHEELYVDIGAVSKEDAMRAVRIGEYMGFDTSFSEFGDGKVKGKALDDRVGCAILMELLKDRYDCDLVAVFAAQEEVGHRGAVCAFQQVKPDVLLMLEGTAANDMPGVPSHEAVTELDRGPAITFMDRGTIVPERMIRALRNTADAHRIPWQFRRGTAGSTDAAAHTLLGGCAAGGVSVPCRYIHSPCSVASVADIRGAYALAHAFLKDRAYEEVIVHG